MKMRLGGIGIHPDRLAKLEHRGAHLSGLAKDDAEHIVRRGVVRIERERLVDLGERGLRVAVPEQLDCRLAVAGGGRLRLRTGAGCREDGCSGHAEEQPIRVSRSIHPSRS